MSDLVGKRLGQYQILDEIGRGGMAVVYKAYQPALERYVAIKVLPQQFTFDGEFVQRFLREARAAARLNHPHIVTIHDVGQADGTYYIVMEYLEGPSLADLIRRQWALPPQQVAQIVAQVASALDHAHGQGFVHRDVKPSNVLLSAGGMAKLTDFGIVRAAEGTRLTQTGTLLGTPEYMSPEQAKALGIDRRSDIYSLGVVAYEMLAGRVPFSGDTLAVQHAHAYEPPDLRVLPAGISAVVGKALAKDPRQRFGSATAFAQALEGAVAGAPVGRWTVEPPARVVARPGTMVMPPWPRAVPAWVWGGAVTVIAGILLALGLAALQLGTISPATSTSATAKPTRQPTSALVRATDTPTPRSLPTYTLMPTYTALPPPPATQTPSPTPLPTVMVEAEWPERMEIDRSDYIRVSLVRTTGGEYVPTIEVIGHTVVAATLVPVGTPEAPVEIAFGPAYKASAVAKLEGNAFEISPLETEYQSLDQDRITWDWNILPLKSGPQIINARIIVQWEPTEGEGDAIERTIWRAPLKIVVEEPWIKTGQLSILSLVSGLLSSVFTAPLLYERIKEAREKRRKEEESKPKIHIARR